MQKIFKNIDSRMVKNRENLIAYAKSKGYNYYSEFIFTEMKTRKMKPLRDEIIANVIGIVPCAVTFWNLRKRIEIEIAGTKNNKKPDSEKRVCVVDGCNRLVPDHLHRFCQKCYNSNKQNKTETERVVPNIGY